MSYTVLNVATTQVVVGNAIPAPNPVPNSATVAFTYTVDPTNPDGTSGTSASNIVKTQINSVIVTSTKTVDKASLM